MAYSFCTSLIIHMFFSHIIFYEIPIFLILLLLVYGIYQLRTARDLAGSGLISKPFNWCIRGTFFVVLWSLVHIVQDILRVSERIEYILHYIVGHGFLFIAAMCVTIAIIKIKELNLGAMPRKDQ